MLRMDTDKSSFLIPNPSPDPVHPAHVPLISIQTLPVIVLNFHLSFRTGRVLLMNKALRWLLPYSVRLSGRPRHPTSGVEPTHRLF